MRCGYCNRGESRPALDSGVIVIHGVVMGEQLELRESLLFVDVVYVHSFPIDEMR